MLGICPSLLAIRAPNRCWKETERCWRCLALLLIRSLYLVNMIFKCMTWVRCYLPSLAYQRLGICDVSTKTWVCYPFAIHPLFKPLFVHAVSFSSVSHYAISQNKFTTRENVSVCISICSASVFFFSFSSFKFILELCHWPKNRVSRRIFLV